MTEQEMRELDGWVAQYGCIKAYCEILGFIPHFTEDPGEFATVKREIERRGWSWQAQSPVGGVYYWFAIFAAKEHDLAQCICKIGEGVGETEEIAGCLAFKAAVEATDGENTDR